MKAGAAIAGGLALGSTAVGAVSADENEGNDEGSTQTGHFAMFLEIDGVKGESTEPAHEDKIDVLAWSWGGSNPVDQRRGGRGGAGRVTLDDLLITKRVDRATPPLWGAMAAGQHFPRAELLIQRYVPDFDFTHKPEDPLLLDYLRIELEPVLISDIQIGGARGEDPPMENVSLNFGRFEMEYTIHDGGKPSETVTTSWDVRTNSP